MSLGTVISTLVALSGWGGFLYNLFTRRPKIRGRILHVIRGQSRHPENPAQTMTAFIVYLYLVNQRRNSVHVLEYEAEAKTDGEWVRLDRVYGMRPEQSFNFRNVGGGGFEIPDFTEKLIYRREEPEVGYGDPAHGFVLFFGPEGLYEADISKYRITCRDAFGDDHTFEVSTDDFESPYLVQDMAGVRGSIPTGSPDQAG